MNFTIQPKFSRFAHNKWKKSRQASFASFASYYLFIKEQRKYRKWAKSFREDMQSAKVTAWLEQWR